MKTGLLLCSGPLSQQGEEGANTVTLLGGGWKGGATYVTCSPSKQGPARQSELLVSRLLDPTRLNMGNTLGLPDPSAEIH